MPNQSLSKIALGTVQFGLDYGISNSHGRTNPQEVSAILNAASKFGIDTLDTAIAYGSSEKVLGTNDLSTFKVISKFPLKEGFPSISSLLDQSLCNLRLDLLYGFMGHSAQVFLEYPVYWDQLQVEKQKGRVENIGVSIYTPKELEQLQGLNIIPDIIQIPYNFLDRRFESYFKELKGQGVEVHTRSAFLQGLFFVDPNTLPDFFSPVKPIINEMQIQCTSREQLAAQLLKFCVSHPFVDKVVIGVNSKEQLLSNITGISQGELSLLVVEDKIPEEVLMPSLWPN